MKLEPVIGLEVHVQLQTRSKAFTSASAAFGAAPNTHTDPVTLAAYRFGIGFLLVLPLALLLKSSFPKGKDGIWVALLGVLFFSIFFVFYNIAMSLTTAARGSLALSCLPPQFQAVCRMGTNPLPSGAMFRNRCTRTWNSPFSS